MATSPNTWSTQSQSSRPQFGSSIIGDVKGANCVTKENECESCVLQGVVSNSKLEDVL